MRAGDIDPLADSDSFDLPGGCFSKSLLRFRTWKRAPLLFVSWAMTYDLLTVYRGAHKAGHRGSFLRERTPFLASQQFR